MIPKFEEENDEINQAYERPLDREVMNEYLTKIAKAEGSVELFDKVWDVLAGHDTDQALHTIATLLVAYEPADTEISELSKKMGVGEIEILLADQVAQEVFNHLTIDVHASPRIILCVAAKLIAFTVARKAFLIDKFGPAD